MQIVAVDPKSARALWVAALPYLERSYKKGDQVVPADLLAQVCWGKRTLWLVVNGEEDIVGAGITAIFETAKGKMLKIEHYGGDGVKLWHHLRLEIESFAKLNGCYKVLTEARPGWRKFLDDYNVTAMILEKRL